MNRFIYIVLAVCVIFASCVTSPPAGNVPEKAPEGRASPEKNTKKGSEPERAPKNRARGPNAPVNAPERPERSAPILGDGRVSRDQLAFFLADSNPQAGTELVMNLADYYVEEAAREGVNHDAAFAQMCLETGFLRFGGLVTPDMNNFCGLGSTGPGHPGEIFPDPRTGVRAHIQHLKGYATDAPLNGELADPRFRWIRRGSAPTIADLAGKWAADPSYGHKIAAILERMYAFAGTEG
jgi:hypothetical protein